MEKDGSLASLSIRSLIFCPFEPFWPWDSWKFKTVLEGSFVMSRIVGFFQNFVVFVHGSRAKGTFPRFVQIVGSNTATANSRFLLFSRTDTGASLFASRFAANQYKIGRQIGTHKVAVAACMFAQDGMVQDGQGIYGAGLFLSNVGGVMCRMRRKRFVAAAALGCFAGTLGGFGQ